MTGDSNTDIDLIWNSLKNENVVSFATSRGVSMNRQCRPIAKATRKQRFAIKDLGPTFDIDAVSAECLMGKHSIDKKEVCGDFVDTCSDLLRGLDVDGASMKLIDGDSDDDEENVKENVPSQQEVSNTSWRIQRVAKAMSSDDISSRVQSLTKLKVTIDALSLDCPVAPNMNYPPPYDDSYIKLNQNVSSVVSDLVRPKQLQNLEPSQWPAESLEAPSIVTKNCSNETRDHLQAILNNCGNSLFRLIGDAKSEKCRVLSIECLQPLLLARIDHGRQVPYMIPALCARYPPCTYDKDTEVFIKEHQLHEFYKRGGAIDRQDRDGLFSHGGIFQVIEPNEELRLELCRTLNCLMRGIMARGAERTLDAYYPEIIFSLQSSLRDPFPEVKIEACHLLVQLLRIPHWEQGAKYFATGLARSALPGCRHRNINVIIAAMDLFEASVCVPDTAKAKGAGTAAIADLVGFREENVLLISAFYDSQCNVSVNTLAELASHKNHRVRLRCCKMLSFFLVYLPDRYDHQQRLLPYILSFINDDMLEIQNAALQCIEKCGLQYECEHPDEVIERRQFGVDGEDTIEYDNNLPAPFTNRPSLGARLFVRANTSRFFLAMLGELSSWKEQTRKRSALLLLVLTVYCEEHLTKDFQHTIASIAKAIVAERSSQCGHYLKTMETMKEVLQLLAKYVDPSAYIPLILPRISGDSSSATSNSEDRTHSETARSSYALILSSLIEGAPLHRLFPQWLTLSSLLSGTNCIGPFAGTKTRGDSLIAFLTLIVRVTIKQEVMTSFIAHFAGTGEQTKFQTALLLCKESLRELLNSSDVGRDTKVATECIDCLSKIEDAAAMGLSLISKN
ncbi:hypothetical protein ACHAXR_006882 [Thalassiosira sp. AJA248-18]